MAQKDKKIITVSMPLDLLTQIDVLAKKSFATRSDILRRAALEYIRHSDLDDEDVKKLAPRYREPKKPERDYDQIIKNLKTEHKYAHLYDKELLAFLDDFNNDRL